MMGISSGTRMVRPLVRWRGFHLKRPPIGNESVAVVEFAPFQKVPNEKKKADSRAGTIEKGMYIRRLPRSLLMFTLSRRGLHIIPGVAQGGLFETFRHGHPRDTECVSISAFYDFF